MLVEAGYVNAGMAEETRVRQLRKVIAASFIGTALEWYDYGLYGIASALIFGTLFFFGPRQLRQHVGGPGDIWGGTIVRPFGGIFFGVLGDRIGRKNILIATLVIMGCATTAIGLVPEHPRHSADCVPLLHLRGATCAGSASHLAGSLPSGPDKSVAR